MRCSRRLSWAVPALFGILVVSCADDPTTTIPPPDTPPTRHLSLVLSGDDVTYSVSWSLDGPTHVLQWDLSGVRLADCAPGQRIVANLTFLPPVIVQYDHYHENFSFMTMGDACIDLFANVPATATSVGWTAEYSDVTFSADCVADDLTMWARSYFRTLVAGEELESLSFDFVVPETYHGEAKEPLVSGDLRFLRASLHTSFMWGNIPSGAPAWQERHTPPH
jgi:hypothetical protein